MIHPPWPNNAKPRTMSGSAGMSSPQRANFRPALAQPSEAERGLGFETRRGRTIWPVIVLAAQLSSNAPAMTIAAFNGAISSRSRSMYWSQSTNT